MNRVFQIYIILLFTHFSNYSKAQVNIEMEQYFTNLMKNGSISEKEKLAKGDSILRIAKDDYSKVVGHFIKANSYLYTNDYDQGFTNIMLADSIIDRNDFPKEKIRSYNMQNAVYIFLKLYSKYEDNLTKIEELLAKEPKDNFYYRATASNLVSKAFLHKWLDQLDEAEKTLKEAISFYEKNKMLNEDGYIKALNDLSVVYSHQNRYDLAIKTLEKLKVQNDKYLKNTYHTLNYYNNVATVYRLKGDYEKAKEFYEIGLAKAKEYNISYYELGFKDNLVLVYDLLNDKVKKDTIQKEFLKDSQEITANAMVANQKVFKAAEEENMKIVEQKQSYIGLIVGIGVVLVLTLLSIIVYQVNKRKKQKEKFLEIIKLYENNSNEDNIVKESTLVEISEQKEKEILILLKEFEMNNLFLDKNMTVSSMATLLNTNTKYLGQILKKHRDSNFSDYINKVRIKYIVNRILKEPELAKYKIGHIAELAGFSSHSRFTIIFKKEVEISPSQFLKEVSK